ncbi:MAG: hypothetical protein KGI50_03100 [Patescibacteria group bacterium]|nr:hypothetical protein [Patescibacteria group bacterium]MDE2438280.1 hypothetical protein [Patescibacteria group bacterium]
MSASIAVQFFLRVKRKEYIKHIMRLLRTHYRHTIITEPDRRSVFQIMKTNQVTYEKVFSTTLELRNEQSGNGSLGTAYWAALTPPIIPHALRPFVESVEINVPISVGSSPR